MCGSSNRNARGAEGFTLLEVLIAFTILAVALTALVQAFSQGLRASTVAEDRATAVLLARSKLAEVGRSIPLEEGKRGGDYENGLGWQVTIGSPQEAELHLGDESHLRIYEVTVLIHRGEHSLFEVRSLRVGPRP